MSKGKSLKGIKFTITAIEGGGYHLFITVKVEGIKCRFLIDTGAAKCVIDRSFYEKKLGRKIKVVQQETSGLHSTVAESYIGKLKTFEIGALMTKKYEVTGVDLTHINGIYKQLKMKRIDGILGSDLMVLHSMVIDYSRSELRFGL